MPHDTLDEKLSVKLEFSSLASLEADRVEDLEDAAAAVDNGSLEKVIFDKLGKAKWVVKVIHGMADVLGDDVRLLIICMDDSYFSVSSTLPLRSHSLPWTCCIR